MEQLHRPVRVQLPELDLQAATEPPSDAEAQPAQDAEVAQASFELGTALIGAADYKGARSAYLSALKMGHPDPHRCRNGAGVSAALEGNQQEAIAQFTAALALEPGDARTLHNRAQAYRALGRWKQAEADAKSRASEAELRVAKKLKAKAEGAMSVGATMRRSVASGHQVLYHGTCIEAFGRGGCLRTK